MNSSAIPIEETPVYRSYGYIPTRYICYLFLTLFGIGSLIHIGQAIWSRRYWLLWTAAFCCILETIGWGMRLWNSINLMENLGYKLQLVFTIVAPTPLLAVNFILIGQIVPLLGPQYSRLSARYYSIIFLLCDILGFFIQVAGGALAASQDDPTMGGNIMLAGIAFQLAAISAFCLLTLEFIWRHIKNRPVRFGPRVPVTNGVITKQLLVLLVALSFNTLCLYVRAVYRLLELIDGWNGVIIATEWYFNVFDGAMIILASYTWIFIHPMFWLPDSVPSKIDKTADGNISLERVESGTGEGRYRESSASTIQS